MTAETAIPTTISELFATTVAARRDEPALGAIVDRRLAWQTWGELAAQVADWSSALAALGAAPGDRVAQLSPNCREWILADLAIQARGAVHVPLHASLAAPQAGEQVAHSGTRLVLVRDAGTAERIRPHLPPELRVVTHQDFPRSEGHT